MNYTVHVQWIKTVLCLVPALLLIPQTYEVEEMVVVAVDILNQIADYNSSILRDYILKHQSDSMDEVGPP